MRADLHIHTTSSDGAWDPEAVAKAAAAGGLDLIAITDHDTTAGVARAAQAARRIGLVVVSGIEVSAHWRGRDVHILVYGFAPTAPALLSHQRTARRARVNRMRTMVGRLQEMGVPVELDRVLAMAGGSAGVVGRPHLAQALLEAGHAASVEEAFDRLIGDAHPAFEPAARLAPVDAVRLAGATGGLAVWAHPPSDLMDSLLPDLVGAGLRGIEVYRPKSSRRRVQRLEGLVRSGGLLATGGSDWHSPERSDPLGTFCMPAERAAAFREALTTQTEAWATDG